MAIEPLVRDFLLSFKQIYEDNNTTEFDDLMVQWFVIKADV